MGLIGIIHPKTNWQPRNVSKMNELNNILYVVYVALDMYSL